LKEDDDEEIIRRWNYQLTISLNLKAEENIRTAPCSTKGSYINKSCI